MKILVKFPCRERPDKFIQTLNKYYSYADNIQNLRFIITLDADDRTMNNPAFLERLSKYPNLEYYIGNSKTKIEAVNADIVDFDWDILLLASDDMIPIIKGYDSIIQKDMQKYYPDTDGVLWYYDGHRRDLNTLCILGLKYYKRTKHIYHPGFITWYADNYFMDVANKLNRQTYIEKCIIEHQHYVWTRQRPDNLAIKENSLRDRKMDEALYKELSKPKLSILICTITGREKLLQRLTDILQAQDVTDVEILTAKDNKQYAVSTKRNHLLDNATGKYLCFIDDDDTVSDDYIAQLMIGIDKDVDCCSLTGIITVNSNNPHKFIHSLKYDSWFEDKKIYYRPPNHLNCIKSEIAKKFRFPDIDWAEDQNWSMQIANAKALKTEHYIDKPIYFYQYKSQK